MAVIDCILIESGVRVFVAWRCCFYFIFFSFIFYHCFCRNTCPSLLFVLPSILLLTLDKKMHQSTHKLYSWKLMTNSPKITSYICKHVATCVHHNVDDVYVHNDLTENGLNLNVVVWFFCADCAGTKVRLKVALSPPHLPESSSSARLLLSGTFYSCHS